jgi:hypothetical protein
MDDKIIKEQITIISEMADTILAMSNARKKDNTIQLMVLGAACFAAGQLIGEAFATMITRYKQTK